MDDKSGYPSGLTASAWGVLIHYFWCPVDMPDIYNCMEVNYRGAKELEAAGLLVLNDEATRDIKWKLTDRGMFLARFIVNLPLPEVVTHWHMPGMLDARSSG